MTEIGSRASDIASACGVIGQADDTLTSAETGRLLGVTRQTLGVFKKTGVITPSSVAMGRRGDRYLRSDVEALTAQRAQLAAKALGDHEPKRCWRCDRPLSGRQHRYCSNRCRDARQRPDHRPKTARGKFICEEWEKSDKSLRKFAKSIGLSHHTVRNLIADKPARKTTLVQLQSIFGDRLPAGEVVNDQWSAHAKSLLSGADPIWKRVHTPEGRAKRAATRRGLPIPEAVKAKARATRSTSPVWHQHMARSREVMSSARMRALQALGNRLRRRTASPDNAVLKTWADEVAVQLQLTPEAVLTLWRPLLVKRGLRGRAGRPRLEKRHQLILDLMTRHRVGPADRMPRGFWAEAVETITEAEGDGPPVEAQLIRQWWIDHKPACPSCLGAEATRQKA
jgi:DNA-binding CsgD family transcriptional regulator